MTDPDRREQLEQLLEAWFLKLENGEQPDLDEHCRQHPELRHELERVLARVAGFDDALAPGRPQRSREAPPTLGEFELLGPLGSGGSGDVFLARQSSLGRLVAIKRMQVAADERSRRRLRREAEVAASLDHPGIVPIYAVGEQDGDAWIAMKWLTGPALDAAGAPLPSREVARIGAAVARALHDAHLAGIVHRDIKPSNIVLDQGRPCIVDFGLARDGDEVMRTTIEGHVSGTLLYMSPEQIRSAGQRVPLDGRSDVYSLGATMYELLVGRPPHEGDHPGEVIHRILEQDPRPPLTERDLATIVMRAIAKEPTDRFASALELALDLERYLAGEPITSRRVGVTTRVWKLMQRNRRASLLVVATTLVSLVLGGVMLWNAQQREILRTAAVQRIGSAIEDQRMFAARNLIDQLATEGETADVARLRKVMRSCEQLEDLLDAVQGRREDISPAQIEPLLELDRSMLPAGRRDEFDLARPLALALLDRRGEAADRLHELPVSRGRDALLAAVDGVEGEWTLPEARSTVDHLFTALALRYLQRPHQERRRELDAALSSGAVPSWRLRLQDASLSINEGEHAVAYRLLLGISSDEGYPRIVRRLLLRQAVWLGRYHDIRLHLQAHRDGHAQHWTAADAGTAVDARKWLRDHRGEDAGFADELRSARERWPEDWYLTMLAAHAKAEDGDQVGTRELLRQAVASARTTRQRVASTLDMLSCDADDVLAFHNPGRLVVGVDEANLLARVAQSAGELIDDAAPGAQRGDAAVLAARSSFVLLDAAAAEAWLQRLPEGHPHAAIERAYHAMGIGFASSGLDAKLRSFASEACQQRAMDVMQLLQSVLPPLRDAVDRLDPKHDYFLGLPARADACLLDAFLSMGVGEVDHAKEALLAAEACLGSPPHASQLDRLEQIRARLQ